MDLWKHLSVMEQVACCMKLLVKSIWHFQKAFWQVVLDINGMKYSYDCINIQHSPKKNSTPLSAKSKIRTIQKLIREKMKNSLILSSGSTVLALKVCCNVKGKATLKPVPNGKIPGSVQSPLKCIIPPKILRSIYLFFLK